MPESAARREWLIRASACAFAVFSVLAPAAAAAGAQSTTTYVSVSPVHVWTDAHASLHSGDTLTIRTSGRIHFGAPPIDRLTAVGIPRGRECDAVATRRSAAATAWPAPALSCWSLIGRIGSGSPFAIGGAHTIRATQTGELFLGVNDNFLGDNAGQWSVTIGVSAAASTITPSESGGAKHASLLPLVAIAVAVVIAAVIFFTWSRRSRRAPRRARRRRVPAPARPRTVAAAPAAERTVRTPVRRAHAGASGAAPVAGDDAFTEVNIFEVEFPDPTTLRVGYNHFLEGTVVAWRVTQHANLLASSEFVAEGGGSRYHFVTMPLGASVESGPSGFVAADVSFSWSIGEVPFGYSVRREPVS